MNDHSRAEVKDLKEVQRSVKIPLAGLPDEQWRDLRRLAFQCAAYGNTLLTESYAKAKGLKAELTPYTDFADVLSAAIRDAVGRECVGIWRRLGKKILRGEQTLARFSAIRALVVRDRGIRLEREGKIVQVRLRLHPRDEGDVTVLPVWMPKKDKHLADLVDLLISKTYRVSKGTVIFERPGRKVFVIVSYAKPVQAVEPASRAATFGLDSDGGLWLRAEDGQRRSFNDAMHRLEDVKANFAGIHRRLRQSLGRRSDRRRLDLRRALLKAGSFETWASGLLHVMSRQIVEWCHEQNVGSLNWELPQAGLMPWAKLRELVSYKGDECGVKVSQIDERKKQSVALRNSDGKEPENLGIAQ